jgi:hypothetical protein
MFKISQLHLVGLQFPLTAPQLSPDEYFNTYEIADTSPKPHFEDNTTVITL